MSQVKRSPDKRKTDLAELLQPLLVFDNPKVVMSALAEVIALQIFMNCDDHKHFEAADLMTYNVKKKLAALRAQVRS